MRVWRRAVIAAALLAAGLGLGAPGPAHATLPNLPRAGGLPAAAPLLAPIPGPDAPPPPGPPVGRIDAATQARLQRVYAAGQALGRRANVLAKVGDSITASGAFLSDAGEGRAILGAHPELAGVIAAYRAVPVDHAGGWAHNSLNRVSLAAQPGWTAADVLGMGQAGPSPLAREYAALNPAVAVIMVGTNDLDRTGVDYFGANLAALVDQTLQAGIIPILTTIPDRTDYPEAIYRARAFDAVIRDEAALEHVPLIDYWTAMQALPHGGLGPDGVHPSTYATHRPASASVTFTPQGLRYGWPLRNYLTLAMLAHLRAVVFAAGAPDP